MAENIGMANSFSIRIGGKVAAGGTLSIETADVKQGGKRDWERPKDRLCGLKPMQEEKSREVVLHAQRETRLIRTGKKNSTTGFVARMSVQGQA